MNRPATNGLTPRQSACLAAIVEHWQQHGQGPTRRELAKALGLRSSCSVQVLVDGLARQGLVERDTYQYRALKPTGAETPAEIIARLTRENEQLRCALSVAVNGGRP